MHGILKIKGVPVTERLLPYTRIIAILYAHTETEEERQCPKRSIKRVWRREAAHTIARTAIRRCASAAATRCRLVPSARTTNLLKNKRRFVRSGGRAYARPPHFVKNVRACVYYFRKRANCKYGRRSAAQTGDKAKKFRTAISRRNEKLLRSGTRINAWR